jgi:hypothetical protein
MCALTFQGLVIGPSEQLLIPIPWIVRLASLQNGTANERAASVVSYLKGQCGTTFRWSALEENINLDALQ